MRVKPLTLSLLASVTLTSCGGGGEVDGGMDSAVDAGGRDTGRSDATAPMCSPECGAAERCCSTGGGSTGCFDLRNDPRHCGECTIDCVGENRGDGCSASTCICGAARLGCDGTREDFCCPPRAGGTERYCANLFTSAADCGGCDQRCDPRRADRCDGEQCRCGTLRDACEGTAESMCCQVGVDIGCVDTTSDRFHCGMCNSPCRAAERCENSVCTAGAACPAGCEADEICCDGTCCTRRACMAGTCGASGTDAGMTDAGPPDAGTSDAK